MPTESCDILLNAKHKIHLMSVEDLSLIIISDLGDFGEYWLAADVIKKSKYEMHFNIRTLAGIDIEGPIQAAARYLVEVIHRARPNLFKFILNINLSREIVDDRANVMMLGDALRDLFHSKLAPSAEAAICISSTSNSRD